MRLLSQKKRRKKKTYSLVIGRRQTSPKSFSVIMMWQKNTPIIAGSRVKHCKRCPGLVILCYRNVS